MEKKRWIILELMILFLVGLVADKALTKWTREANAEATRLRWTPPTMGTYPTCRPEICSPTPKGWPYFYGVTMATLRPPPTQPKMIDLATNVPWNDKMVVLVRHADGSLTQYVMSPQMYDGFLELLPKSDTITNVVSLMLPGLPPMYWRSPLLPRIIDLATDLPMNEKMGVIVQHAYGGMDEYFFPLDMYNGFKELLPDGDRIVASSTLIPIFLTPTPSHTPSGN